MLERFISEVLLNGAQACLPKNLSKEWLDSLEHELWEYFTKCHGKPSDGNESKALCCVLAAVMAITSVKLKRSTIKISIEDLHERLGDYRLELVLETLHRSSALFYNPATLETIFTNRDLNLSLSFLEQIAIH
jgi:hypothetical protein